MKKFVFFLLLSGSLSLIGGAAPAEDDLKRILSGDEKIIPLSERTLAERLGSDWESFRMWWARETDALWWFAGGTVLVLLLGCGGFLLIRHWQKTHSLSRKRGWRTELFRALAEPVLFLLCLTGIFVFSLPLLNSMPDFYVVNIRIIFTLFALVVAWGGMAMIGVFSRRMDSYARRDDNNLDVLMVEIVRKLLKIILVLVTLFFIGQNIFSLNITALLAGAGVLGLAIAFASKETLSNFFGTLVIILDRPFRCGDRIQINHVDGIVTDVGMRSTRLLTRSESVYTIPNSLIESSSIENISSRGVIRFLFTVGLVYDSTPEKIALAMKILTEITTDFHGKDQERYKPRVFFDNFGDSALNIEVIMWLKSSSYSDEEKMRSEINLTIMERFNEAKLVMAYNTVTNYIGGDGVHPLQVTLTRP